VTDSFVDLAERFGDSGLVERLAKIGSQAA
jgi:hypothetical protein